MSNVVLRRWYSLQVSLIEFLWGRLPVLTQMCFFWDDRTVEYEVSWIRRSAYLTGHGTWVMIPRREDRRLAYRVLAGLVVMPTLTYAMGEPFLFTAGGDFEGPRGVLQNER